MKLIRLGISTKIMYRQLLLCALSFAAATTAGQGLINFQNTPTKLVSAGQIGHEQLINGPPGAYYFALLTNSGTLYTFAGVYATNTTVAGMFSGGAAVAVPGWPGSDGSQAGQGRSVEIAGWSADLGHDWNPKWLAGVFPSASTNSVFGISGQGGCIAGATVPVWGPGELFMGANIDGIASGFNLAPVIQPQATSAATFLPTGSIPEARFEDTATLVSPGNVLLAGGSGTTTELYDPVVGTWSTVGEMSSIHSFGAAVLLLGGKVLLTGGSSTNSEIFDPATKTWSLTGGLNTPRIFHTATILGSGKVLVAAGSADGFHGLISAELYDPTTEVWTTTGSMQHARFRHSATLLPDGRVLVAGGQDLGGFGGVTTLILNSVEIYDPTTGKWTSAQSLSTARYRHTATLMPNGQVLVVGGYYNGFLPTSELFDPIANTWTLTGNLNFARDSHTATLLANGKVLVTGGVGMDTNYHSFQLASAELYDPSSGTWSMTSSLNTGRYFHTATLLPDGQRVLITGGGNYNSGAVFSTAELYVPGAKAVQLTNTKLLSDSTFQFTFSYTPGTAAQVLASTNPGLPLSQWTVLGNVTEVSPGQFQFTDSQTTNIPIRFYHIGSTF